MSVLWLVSQHVDRQKRELLQHLLDSGACDAEHAIDLSDVAVKPSILRAMTSRNIVKRTASGLVWTHLDPERLQTVLRDAGPDASRR